MNRQTVSVGSQRLASGKDSVWCQVWLAPELGPARWAYEIRRGDTLVASGHVPHARDERSALLWVERRREARP